MEGDITKLQIARKLLLQPLFLNPAFKWSAGQKNFWEISPKQIEENQGQSQIITGERLPSCSLSLTTKIILIIFTTANTSPSLIHRPFDGF